MGLIRGVVGEIGGDDFFVCYSKELSRWYEKENSLVGSGLVYLFSGR